jgi:hypothetical protein
MHEFSFSQVYFIIIFDPFLCISGIGETCQRHKLGIAEFDTIIHLASKMLSHTLLGTSISGPYVTVTNLATTFPQAQMGTMPCS